LERLTAYSEALVKELRQNPGLADVDTTLSNRKPELQVHIDRDKASQFGLHITDIAVTLRTLVGGEIIGVFKEKDEQYDVWLRADAAHRGTAEALQQVFVRTRPSATSSLRPEMVPLAISFALKKPVAPTRLIVSSVSAA